jgi:hypothetical protein
MRRLAPTLALLTMIAAFLPTDRVHSLWAAANPPLTRGPSRSCAGISGGGRANANLANGAARHLDHARGMRFRNVMHSLGSGGRATLSVTDNCRRRGGDQLSYTGKYGREPT